MKKNKTLALLIVLCILICSFSSCVRSTYKYMQDKSNISSISIVEASYSYDGEAKQITLLEISDVDEFLDGLARVPYYPAIAPPDGITYNQLAIKIKYLDGEYELFNCYGESTCTKEAYYVCTDTGYFDKERYKEFINSYVSKAENPKYNFLYPSSDIRHIEIVEAYYDDNDNAYKQTSLSSIENTQEFLASLYDIKYSYSAGVYDRQDYIREPTKAIKITYLNGDFEVFTNNIRDIYELQIDTYFSGAYIGEFQEDSFCNLLEQYNTNK